MMVGEGKQKDASRYNILEKSDLYHRTMKRRLQDSLKVQKDLTAHLKMHKSKASPTTMMNYMQYSILVG